MKYLSLLMLLGVMSAVGQATAASYTVTAINFPNALSTSPKSINNAGLVAGSYLDQAVVDHGFTYDSKTGIYTSIDSPKGTYGTVVVGVTNKGQIAGYSFAGNNRELNFILLHGRYHYYDIPQQNMGVYSQAINDLDTTTGWYSDGVSVYTFIHTKSGMTTLTQDNGNGTLPLGINNSGIIVGYDQLGGQVAFSRAPNGIYTNYSYPGAQITIFSGINTAGVIVGAEAAELNANSPRHGLIVEGGVTTLLPDVGAAGTIPFAINDKGVIVGESRAQTGPLANGFMLTPSH